MLTFSDIAFQYPWSYGTFASCIFSWSKTAYVSYTYQIYHANKLSLTLLILGNIFCRNIHKSRFIISILLSHICRISCQKSNKTTLIIISIFLSLTGWISLKELQKHNIYYFNILVNYLQNILQKSYKNTIFIISIFTTYYCLIDLTCILPKPYLFSYLSLCYEPFNLLR